MKIITLIENYAIDRGILAEHGLSMYIETHLKDGTIDKRILFDTGQSGTFIQNAGNDLPAVSYATVYPLTMFLRVLTAQLLILFF